MESTLKDSRGTSPCVVRGSGTFTLFSPRCQTLLQQVGRDDKVRALFEAIRDAFDFAKDADALRNINPESRQARLLEEMLQCVSEIGTFIRLYADHVQVGMSLLASLVGEYRHMIYRNADLEEYLRSSRWRN
jgi:hypothetical protein